MQAGKLHPSINVDELDPEIDLDVCAGSQAIAYPVQTLMKSSFGFGGINSVSVLRRFEG
jgi:3-oxoacyl-(acyl-carrier-protein) synthase